MSVYGSNHIYRLSSVMSPHKNIVNMNSRNSQAGIGLIEVLIAVLVLSVGILGMAALQTRTLANNGSSMSLSMETIASYSILEAMRADRVNALGGLYNKTVTVGSCPTDTSTLANQQLATWCSGSGSTPPNGLSVLGSGAKGIISCDIVSTCTVTVVFADKSDLAQASNTSTQTVVTKAGI